MYCGKIALNLFVTCFSKFNDNLNMFIRNQKLPV